MATHDVDQKILGRLATTTAAANPVLSAALFRILGLSILLSRRLYRARKLRKLDISRDTKSLAQYHHIIWLSREGLILLEIYVLPSSEEGQLGNELRVLGAKLRASFYHVFCLFHNQPPISQLGVGTPVLVSPRAGPLSPIHANGGAKQAIPSDEARATAGSPAAATSNTKQRSPPQPIGPLPSVAQPKRSPAQERKAALRDAIPSMTSEASYITNPFASDAPQPQNPALPPHNLGQIPHDSLMPPPGLNLPSSLSAESLNPIPIPYPSAFLLPLKNFLPQTESYFNHATSLAASYLSGSAPLRLSVALEHSAFLWDCLSDHAGSRRLAKRAIADVYRAQEGMDDNEFEDAAGLVGTLGRMMKRGSVDGTPKAGALGRWGTPLETDNTSEVTAQSPPKSQQQQIQQRAPQHQNSPSAKKPTSQSCDDTQPPTPPRHRHKHGRTSSTGITHIDPEPSPISPTTPRSQTQTQNRRSYMSPVSPVRASTLGKR